MAGTIRPDSISVSGNTLTTTTPGIPEMNVKIERKQTEPRARRIDVEPLYAAVKGSMGEGEWGIYKSALGQFMIGMWYPSGQSRGYDGELGTLELLGIHAEHIV
jgi:transcriptional coactivator HFI1/ADA1